MKPNDDLKDVRTPEMLEAETMALDFQRMAMEDGDPTSMPHGIVLTPDKKVTAIAFAVDLTPEGKRVIMMQIMKYLLESPPNTVVAFTTDTWQGSAPISMIDSLPPLIKDWPAEYRTEVVSCFLNEMGHRGVFVQQAYTRNSDGKPVWGELGVKPYTEGRFLLDLRPETMAKKIKDLLDRKGR